MVQLGGVPTCPSGHPGGGGGMVQLGGVPTCPSGHPGGGGGMVQLGGVPTCPSGHPGGDGSTNTGAGGSGVSSGGGVPGAGESSGTGSPGGPSGGGAPGDSMGDPIWESGASEPPPPPPPQPAARKSRSSRQIQERTLQNLVPSPWQSQKRDTPYRRAIMYFDRYCGMDQTGPSGSLAYGTIYHFAVAGANQPVAWTAYAGSTGGLIHRAYEVSEFLAELSCSL